MDLLHRFPRRTLGCNEMFTSLYRLIHLSLYYRSVWPPGCAGALTSSSCVQPETRMLKISRWPVGTEQRRVMVFACFLHLVQISNLMASLLGGAVLGFFAAWRRFVHCCAFSVVLSSVLHVDSNPCVTSAALLTASLLMRHVYLQLPISAQVMSLTLFRPVLPDNSSPVSCSTAAHLSDLTEHDANLH